MIGSGERGVRCLRKSQSLPLSVLSLALPKNDVGVRRRAAGSEAGTGAAVKKGAIMRAGCWRASLSLSHAERAEQSKRKRKKGEGLARTARGDSGILRCLGQQLGRSVGGGWEYWERYSSTGPMDLGQEAREEAPGIHKGGNWAIHCGQWATTGSRDSGQWALRRKVD